MFLLLNKFEEVCGRWLLCAKELGMECEVEKHGAWDCFVHCFLALWGNWTRETTLYKFIEHEYNMETMRPAGSAVELGLV